VYDYFAPDLRGVFEADDGTRAHNVPHGKQNRGERPQTTHDPRGRFSPRVRAYRRRKTPHRSTGSVSDVWAPNGPCSPGRKSHPASLGASGCFGPRARTHNGPPKRPAAPAGEGNPRLVLALLSPGKVAEEQSDWLANRRPSLSSLWVWSPWLSAAAARST
jgi:hypothetical protein